jgi:DDE family transposase
MHSEQLLHRVFDATSQTIDKRLHRCLLKAASTLSDCKHLSIAGLGRCLISSTAVKYSIKRIDRLFGNLRLHQRRYVYYQTMVNLLIGSNPKPVILIDWSGLTRCGEYHFLRASVPVGGRALVIWESTYREKDYTSQKTHRAFIKELKALLPTTCRPIIVTDAGFRCPWFKLIHKQGWDFVGRVRNRTQCRETGLNDWLPVKHYYDKATRSARYLFNGLLARDNPVDCHFYLFRGTKKQRVRKNLRGKKVQCSVSLKHAKREREPWLIVSSLSPEVMNPAQIIQLYKTRMQIEEAFRDLKNTRNGFSLRHCRSFDVQRLNVALLIAAIAMLLLWIIGMMVKQKNEHYLYQANTVRHRSVLSTFTIGWQALKRKQRFCLTEFIGALKEIQRVAKHDYAT